MSAKSKIMEIGNYAFGCVILAAVMLVPIAFLVGGVWAAERFLPWLARLSVCLLAFNTVILAPLAIFPVTRRWAGFGFYISSFVFGLTTWLIGLLLTWVLWGGLAVVIGLCFFGIGVVPMGAVATLLRGMWTEFILLLLGAALTFGLRGFGISLAASETESFNQQRQDDNAGVKERRTTEKSDLDGMRNEMLQLFFKTVRSGNLNAVQKFLARTPNFAQAADDDGGNALFYAVKEGHESIIALLLSYDISLSQRNEALADAAYAGNLSIVKLLLEHNADPNSNEDEACGEVVPDMAGRTPLHEAAESNATQILKLLVERGANVDAIDRKGRTALHYAAKNGNSEIAELLLANSAATDLKTKTGDTALQVALTHFDADSAIVRLLRESGHSARRQ